MSDPVYVSKELSRPADEASALFRTIAMATSGRSTTVESLSRADEALAALSGPNSPLRSLRAQIRELIL